MLGCERSGKALVDWLLTSTTPLDHFLLYENGTIRFRIWDLLRKVRSPISWPEVKEPSGSASDVPKWAAESESEVPCLE